MFERVRIQNFRCLKDIDAELRALTVLIGPNDSGKSAFLAAVVGAFEAHAFRETDHWRGSFDNAVSISLAERGFELQLGPEFEMLTTGAGRAKHYKLSGEGQGLGAVNVVQFFDLPSDGPKMTCPWRPDGGMGPALDTAGENVPSLLDFLLRRDLERRNAFADAMRNRVPGLKDLLVEAPANDTRRLDLRIENDLVIPADDASAGVRLMLFFVALTFHPSPPDVILLEEPEKGVHPARLNDIMNLLRDITKGTHCGHAAQVILTTHSPYLLDHVNLDTDQVLVFRRSDDGSCTAEPVDRERMKQFLDEFMLGEVWFNEKEGGLVKRKE